MMPSFAIFQLALRTAVAVFSFLIIAYVPIYAQETNSDVSGMVQTPGDTMLHGASITIVHQPTNNTYAAFTNDRGFFHLFNLKPGGPYSITISYSGYHTITITDLFLHYGNPNFFSMGQNREISQFVLMEKTRTLEEIKVISTGNIGVVFGPETNINQQVIQSVPSISRNFQDFVRLATHARVNGEGMMSLAGQNNKFNNFFIDGSPANDLLGIARSGTVGGQTGTPPVSIEAIEELKISTAPYDAQYSNFTGAAINAITRSGSNQFKSSAWYFFRNEKMAGRSPAPVSTPGLDKPVRTRLPDFLNQTAGLWISGAVKKNNLFYFLLAEFQNELQPQTYVFSEYRGSSTLEQIHDLADTIRNRHGYEPGTFLETADDLQAKRFIVKLDWNPGLTNKFTFSYRLNLAERIAPQLQNSPFIIRFSNNRFSLISNIHSASIEWKKFLKRSASNRLLVTYNNEMTDRGIIGQPFPTVNILDDGGMITFGSNALSQLNVFNASELNLLNVFRKQSGNHSLSGGIDVGISKVNDVIIPSYYGQYTFRSRTDFIDNNYANRYVRGVSLADQPVKDRTAAGARFNLLRTGIFINDQYKVNKQLDLNIGFRLDGKSAPLKYPEDVFFNSIAKTEIEKYYNLEGAVSGKPMKTHWQISPRFGVQYKVPGADLIVRGGAGVFMGKLLNIWVSELYFARTHTFDITPHTFPFNPDPYRQPGLSALGIDPENNRGDVLVVSEKFKYPTVFRMSGGMEKRIDGKWSILADMIFTKNIHEHRYLNVNLAPPSLTTAPPGSRSIYSLASRPQRIPMPGNNPYNNIYLLTNNHDRKGFSYNASISVDRNFNSDWAIRMGYSYGLSVALLEPVGNGNNSDQWAQIESVNGKNTVQRSVSDFDPGHRLLAVTMKKFRYRNCITMISIFYNGQSGSPYSYVYGGTITNDNGRTEKYDLVYVPTEAELNMMEFIPNSHSAAKQRELLNKFIESDRYLRKTRGNFAERNGARTPFTHTIDLRVQQDFKIKSGNNTWQVSVIYDVFNLANMLNKNWGRTYFISFDKFEIINVKGFNSSLSPEYQFTPLEGKPWSIQNSSAPGSSARWISQLGIRININ